MSAPAAVLSQLADLAVDGAAVAALVLVSVAAIKAVKLLELGIGRSASMAMWDRVNDRAIDLNGQRLSSGEEVSNPRADYGTASREEIRRSRWF